LTDPLLAAFVGVLGGGLLTIATLAGAFLFRRIHELRDRIVAIEGELDVLRPLHDYLRAFGAKRLQALGGARRAR
jgi:hypothetical protein